MEDEICKTEGKYEDEDAKCKTGEMRCERNEQEQMRYS